MPVVVLDKGLAQLLTKSAGKKEFSKVQWQWDLVGECSGENELHIGGTRGRRSQHGAGMVSGSGWPVLTAQDSGQFSDAAEKIADEKLWCGRDTKIKE